MRKHKLNNEIIDIDPQINKNWGKIGFKLKINTYIFTMVIALFYVIITSNYIFLVALTTCALITLFVKKSLQINLKNLLYVIVSPLIVTVIIYRSSEFDPLLFDFTRIVFRHNIYTPFILMFSMLMTMFYKNNKNLVIICIGPLLCLAMSSDWSVGLFRKNILYKMNINIEFLFYGTLVLGFGLLIKTVYTYYHPQKIKLFSKKIIFQLVSIIVAVIMAVTTLFIYNSNRITVNVALQQVLSLLTSIDNYILYGNRNARGINNKLSLDGQNNAFSGNDNSIVMRVKKVLDKDIERNNMTNTENMALSYLRGNSYTMFSDKSWSKGFFIEKKTSTATDDSNNTIFFINKNNQRKFNERYNIFLDSSSNDMLYIPDSCYKVKTIADTLEIDYGGNIKMKKWSASSGYDVFIPVSKYSNKGFNNGAKIDKETMSQYLQLNLADENILKKWLLKPNSKKTTRQKLKIKELKQRSFNEKLEYIRNKLAKFEYNLEFYNNLGKFKITLRKKVKKDPNFYKKIENEFYQQQRYIKTFSRKKRQLKNRNKDENSIKKKQLFKKIAAELKSEEQHLDKENKSQVINKYIKNYSPVDFFINDAKSGHCEMFATTTVLSLRLLDIPSRYVTGYMCVEKSPFGYYVVRQSNAHAWVEAYDKKTQTWFRVDNTPGSDYNNEGQKQWSSFAKLKEQLTMFFKNLVASFKQGNFTNFIGGVMDELIIFLKILFTNPRSITIFIIVILIIISAITIKIKGIRWLFHKNKHNDFTPIYKELKNFEKTLSATTNTERLPSQSYYDYFSKINVTKPMNDMLMKWCESFYNMRYSKDKITDIKRQDIATLQAELIFLNKQIKKQKKSHD